MLSATAAVGARSAAARVPGSVWQGAPPPDVSTAGAVHEAWPRLPLVMGSVIQDSGFSKSVGASGGTQSDRLRAGRTSKCVLRIPTDPISGRRPAGARRQCH